MKAAYEMSWIPPKRTLQNVAKIKLAYEHPLPENVNDVAPVNEFMSFTQNQVQFERSGSSIFSDFNASLPEASQIIDDGYLQRYENTSEFGQWEDSDLEILSELEGTDGSSLDNSSASFLSWADDVEVQGSSKAQQLFEELEMALYEDGPSLVEDEELANECLLWKRNYVFLRVLGKKPSYTQEVSEQFSELENECGDIDGEILASHGFVDESPKIEASIESGDTVPICTVSHEGNLIEKVKGAVLDQLTCYALSEALKTFEHNQPNKLVIVEPNNKPSQADDAASALANLSEDLGRALQISGRSMHRSPKALGSEYRRKTVTSCVPEHIQLGVQSKRFYSNINVIPEDKICVSPDHSFSVFGIPKLLNTEVFSHKTKILEKRGYHSAADRKKPGFLDRRFSCISPEHERLLTPPHEDEDCEPNSAVTMNTKQISAPNTPLKLLRHLTLPPIQNLNSDYKLSVNSDEKSSASLTHVRRIFVKNKVSLSPLPNAVNVLGGGLTELKLAKRLLDSTPDSGHWNSYHKTAFSDVRNGKTKRKTVEKFKNNQ